jgi:hypothetical protein
MAAGVAIGYAAGGTVRNLVATRFRALWLLWAIAAAQFADVITAARTWVFVGTFAAAVGWLVVNALRWPPALRSGALTVAAGGLRHDPRDQLALCGHDHSDARGPGGPLPGSRRTRIHRRLILASHQYREASAGP